MKCPQCGESFDPANSDSRPYCTEFCRNRHVEELESRVAELEDIQGNLATMIRRLITKQNPISQKTKDQCWDYLQRKGLQGSVLRDER